MQLKEHQIPDVKVSLSAVCFILLRARSKWHFSILMFSSRSLGKRSTVSTLESFGKYGMCKGGANPYRAFNSVIMIIEWNKVLYHHSAKGNHFT